MHSFPSPESAPRPRPSPSAGVTSGGLLLTSMLSALLTTGSLARAQDDTYTVQDYMRSRDAMKRVDAGGPQPDQDLRRGLCSAALNE